MSDHHTPLLVDKSNVTDTHYCVIQKPLDIMDYQHGLNQQSLPIYQGYPDIDQSDFNQQIANISLKDRSNAKLFFFGGFIFCLPLWLICAMRYKTSPNKEARHFAYMSKILLALNILVIVLMASLILLLLCY